MPLTWASSPRSAALYANARLTVAALKPARVNLLAFVFS